MEAQLRQEEDGRIIAANSNQRILLSDRSAIDPVVYAVLTSRTESDARDRRNKLVNLPKFQLTLPMYRQAIFILLKPVPEWLVDDGVRSLDNQTQCLSVFRTTLTELGIVYEEMGGEMKDLNKRVSKVLEYVSISQLNL